MSSGERPASASNIQAGAENLRQRACDHERSHGIVRGRSVKRRDHAAHHRQIERIHRRVRQLDAGNAARDLIANAIVGAFRCHRFGPFPYAPHNVAAGADC